MICPKKQKLLRPRQLLRAIYFCLVLLSICIFFFWLCLMSRPFVPTLSRYCCLSATGPNLFQHSIQEMMYHGPIRLYYTMCDEDWNENVIINKFKKYGGFVWLHYDKSIRRFNWHKRNHITFKELVRIIRTKVTPPTYEELFPTMSVTATTDAEAT